MKRFLTLLLSILYLGVSSGFALQVHYCMDEISAFTLMPEKSEKCDTCGMKGNSCCRDEVTFIKIQDAHKQPVFSFQTDLNLSVLPPVLFTDAPPRLSTVMVTGFANSSPPLLFPLKRNVLHCRFNV